MNEDWESWLEVQIKRLKNGEVDTVLSDFEETLKSIRAMRGE